jgi:hypothetical protein
VTQWLAEIFSVGRNALVEGLKTDQFAAIIGLLSIFFFDLGLRCTFAIEERFFFF